MAKMGRNRPKTGIFLQFQTYLCATFALFCATFALFCATFLSTFYGILCSKPLLCHLFLAQIKNWHRNWHTFFGSFITRRFSYRQQSFHHPAFWNTRKGCLKIRFDNRNVLSSLRIVNCVKNSFVHIHVRENENHKSLKQATSIS